MKEIIGTIIIMLFCIAALTFQNNSDGTTTTLFNPEGDKKSKSKAGKPGRGHEKSLLKFFGLSHLAAPVTMQLIAVTQNGYASLNAVGAQCGKSYGPIGVRIPWLNKDMISLGLEQIVYFLFGGRV